MKFRIIPSHHLRDEYLIDYGHEREVFVETGTYMGDALQIARLLGYKRIYSCEAYEPLYTRAVQFFKDDPEIKLYFADSTEFLVNILSNEIPNDRCTFWLDAHRSGPLAGSPIYGDCPLKHELAAIKNHSTRNDHTIFIDNKSLFGSDEWGGVEWEEIRECLLEINPEYKIIFLEGVLPEDIICAWIP